MLTKRQAELLGRFAGLPVNITNYYLNKFTRNTPFMTIADSFNTEELIGELVMLSIVPRGTKAPYVELNGFKTFNVKPDMIKGSATLTPLDNLEIQAGQTPTIYNGTVIENGKYLDEKKLSILKNGWENTRAAMASQLYLTGVIPLKNSGDKLDFKFATPKGLTFTRGVDYWELFFIDRITEYIKENQKAPTHIEVDKEILKEIVKDANLAGQQKAYNFVQILPKAAQELEQRYPDINILNMMITTLVPAIGLDGKVIDTENMIYLSNDGEFISTYVGIGVAVGNDVRMIKADVYVDFLIQKDPAEKKYILESGFCPVVPVPKRIMRWKITMKDKA